MTLRRIRDERPKSVKHQTTKPIDRMKKSQETVSFVSSEGEQITVRKIKSSSEIECPMKVDDKEVKKWAAWEYRYGRPTFVVMSPDTFLRLFPLQKKYTSKKSLDSIRKGIKKGSVFDIPFVDIELTGVAARHEGRHRATVLKEMGVKEMPVILYDKRFLLEEENKIE